MVGLECFTEVFHILPQSGGLFSFSLFFQFTAVFLHVFSNLMQTGCRLIFRQKDLSCRKDHHFFQFFHRTLTLYINASYSVYLGVPEFNPHRRFFCQRENIHDTAPDRKLSFLFHLSRLFIAHSRQLFLQLFQIKFFVRRYLNLLFFILFKRKAVIHTCINGSDHRKIFLL